MNNFDIAINSFIGFTGYIGNPPNNEEEYANIEWIATWDSPTWAQVQIAMDNVSKQDCKKQASALLYETDWTTIPDVADPSNSPYLTNQAEFIAWRSQVRALAVNPVVDPVFPPKPTEIWG